MKKIEVIVKDRNTLVLNEDASKGDYIDLTSLTSIDSKQIEEAINAGKDEVYKTKLTTYEKKLALEFENTKNKIISEYKEQLSNLNILKEKSESEFKTKITQLELESRLTKEKELGELKNSYESKMAILNEQIKNLQETERLKVENEYKDLLSKKELELQTLKSTQEKNLLAQENEFNEKLARVQAELRKKEEDYNTLQRQKASLNVKQTGEDLEAWCDNEVKSYMQNGLSNCVWFKDNQVIREEVETKGSKADYIFKIYADNNHNESTLLASVCLDMKDENPDSQNRKKNSDYYKALDNNRRKKNCKYALLVSNLELDRPNDLPIFKVNEYSDMYVVRPAYMMTFLNMLVSLTVRFQNLITASIEKHLEIQSKLELSKQFEELKKTYLDKPLENLEKNINDICSQNAKITSASKTIEELCEKIKKNYLDAITQKLDRFDIKIKKVYKD